MYVFLNAFLVLGGLEIYVLALRDLGAYVLPLWQARRQRDSPPIHTLGDPRCKVSSMGMRQVSLGTIIYGCVMASPLGKAGEGSGEDVRSDTALPAGPWSS